MHTHEQNSCMKDLLDKNYVLGVLLQDTDMAENIGDTAENTTNPNLCLAWVEQAIKKTNKTHILHIIYNGVSAKENNDIGIEV